LGALLDAGLVDETHRGGELRMIRHPQPPLPAPGHGHHVGAEREAKQLQLRRLGDDTPVALADVVARQRRRESAKSRSGG
jgi:hypothetical protein